MGDHLALVRTRVDEFMMTRALVVRRVLGWGWDGLVIATRSHTAVKGFKFSEQYTRERDVYLRLFANDVEQILGFSVPQIMSYDDELMVIEMTVVSPPFVLDFAGARLDSPAEYPRDVLQEWEREKQEQFEDDWPIVRSVMAEFERFGVYLCDLHPGNIRLRPER